MEYEGRNTRGQALGILNMLQTDAVSNRVLLITSPDHTRRALLTFRKAGFGKVAADAAFSEAVKGEITYKSEDLGGNKGLLPEAGDKVLLRYRFWSNAGYLSMSTREAMALVYYKLRGWI